MAPLGLSRVVNYRYLFLTFLFGDSCCGSFSEVCAGLLTKMRQVSALYTGSRLRNDHQRTCKMLWCIPLEEQGIS